MHHNLILDTVRAYLTNVSAGEKSPVPPEVMAEYLRAQARLLTRQLGEGRDKFRLRMSNIGRPQCQLWHEKTGTASEPRSYSSIMNALFGDSIEALAVAILKLSGVPVSKQFQRVAIELDGYRIAGEYDVDIEGVIYDIKSASDYSFNNKFDGNSHNGGILDDHFVNSDHFGYFCQGYLYAAADGKRFGGWIVVNKNDGEWTILAAPDEEEKYRELAIRTAKDTIRYLDSGADFKRSFEDAPELFKKKPTGNRLLKSPCSFCSYKQSCWKGLQYKPSPYSQAMNPRWSFYTKYNDRKISSDDNSEL